MTNIEVLDTQLRIALQHLDSRRSRAMGEWLQDGADTPGADGVTPRQRLAAIDAEAVVLRAQLAG